MPYSPTPFQELPSQWLHINKVWRNAKDTDLDTEDGSATLVPVASNNLMLALAVDTNDENGKPSNGSTFIKGQVLDIASGPPGAVTTGILSPSYKIEAVEFDFDAVVGLSGSSGFVNVLLAKVPSGTRITTSGAIPAAATSITVTNAYAAITASAGPAVAAAFGKTLSRYTLTGASNAVAGARVNMDLTSDIVATTAANSVTTTDEDFRLYPGDRLVLILLPANAAGTADTSTTARIRNLKTNVILNKVNS